MKIRRRFERSFRSMAWVFLALILAACRPTDDGLSPEGSPDRGVERGLAARFDWFEYADLPVQEVRDRFSIPPKSDRAIAAGSVGPWDHGGISEFQLAAGRALAEREGRDYEYDLDI